MKKLWFAYGCNAYPVLAKTSKDNFVPAIQVKHSKTGNNVTVLYLAEAYRIAKLLDLEYYVYKAIEEK